MRPIELRPANGGSVIMTIYEGELQLAVIDNLGEATVWLSEREALTLTQEILPLVAALEKERRGW